MWMTSFDRKKHQRKMNRYVRAMNQNIAKDNLWRGRFIVREVGSPNFYIYPDKSGAELDNVCLTVIDLKTGQQVSKCRSANEWCSYYGDNLWRFVNDAIVEDFDVWNTDKDFQRFRNGPFYDFNNPKVRRFWKDKWEI